MNSASEDNSSRFLKVSSLVSKRNSRQNVGKGTWVLIGRIGKAKGLDGAFFVVGRQHELTASAKIVRIGETAEKSTEFKVIRLQSSSQKTTLKLDEISSREQLAQYVGKSLYIHRDDIEIDEDVEYLWADIEGKKLVDSEGTAVGVIEHVYNSGAGDVVIVKADERKQVDIPLNEKFVDMSFEASAECISLKVSISVFKDFFYEA